MNYSDKNRIPPGWNTNGRRTPRSRPVVVVVCTFGGQVHRRASRKRFSTSGLVSKTGSIFQHRRRRTAVRHRRHSLSRHERAGTPIRFPTLPAAVDDWSADGSGRVEKNVCAQCVSVSPSGLVPVRRWYTCVELVIS